MAKNMIGFLTEEQTKVILNSEYDYLIEQLQEVGKFNIDYLNSDELEFLLDLEFTVLENNTVYVESYDEVKHEMCLTNYI